MTETPKLLAFCGSSLDDLRRFPAGARREAGFQLDLVQNGRDPDDWKPMSTIGQGVREIRVRDGAGAFRVIYVAKFADAITTHLSGSGIELFRRLVEDYSREHNVPMADIAAALALQSRDGEAFLMVEQPPDKRRERVKPDREGGRDDRKGPPKEGFATYRIAVGKRHKVIPGAIVGAIANEGGLNRSDFGHISIRVDHSLVELPAKLSKDTLKKLENPRISGQLINLELDKGGRSGGYEDRGGRPDRGSYSDRGGRQDRGPYKGRGRDDDRRGGIVRRHWREVARVSGAGRRRGLDGSPRPDRRQVFQREQGRARRHQHCRARVGSLQREPRHPFQRERHQSGAQRWPGRLR